MLSSSMSSILFKRCLLTRHASTKAVPDFALRRAFSSQIPSGPMRSTPQYTIFGEKTMLSVKVIPPVFRCLRNGSLVLDNNKKGRILLEWSPRGEGGGFVRDAQIRFGLSPEETGFLLHQLPDNEVEFLRRLPADTPGAVAGDMPEKVLKITPGEGGQFAFKIDFVKDGVGGQNSGSGVGPLEVVAQLGEYMVMRELFQRSLPSLIGWDVQLNLAMQNAMNLALQNNHAPTQGKYVKPAAPAAEAAEADLPF